MIKKYLCFIFICFLLITANVAPVSAQIQTNKDAALAAKIKTKVTERGIGKNKRVGVKKKDGTELKGYVSQADEDSFTVTDSKTNQSVEVSYDDVAKLKNRSSKGDKIAYGIILGAVAVVAVVVVSFVVQRCQNEGGC